MEEALVSIIVPVYKMEKYLGMCMESILKQTYPALEVILVDDGSPDGCPGMCDRYADDYRYVSVIHQQNQGLGMSRNAGLRAAKGEYVFFVDSDDALDGEDAVGVLVRRAQERQADITVGCYRRFQEGEISDINFHHLSEEEDSRSVSFRFKGFYQYGHLAYNWGKLYRRSFLLDNELWCQPYPFTQDKAHNMACYAYKPKYAFVSESVYLYRMNEESVTFRYKSNLKEVWLSIAKDFDHFLAERGLAEDYCDLTALHIFFGSFFIVKQELQFQKHGLLASAKEMKSFCRDPYVKKAVRTLCGGGLMRQMPRCAWRLVVPVAAFLLKIHAYLLFAFGIALLRRMEVDKRITASRYQKK